MQTYKPTPAISFFVDCESESQIDALWHRLSADGTVMMEIGEYPFSKKFGWLADKYGMTWQLSLSGSKQTITPYLMFTEGIYRKAEEAIGFYTGVFGDAKLLQIQRYGKDMGEAEDTVMFASFQLEGQSFMCADSGYPHGFTVSEGTSFNVYCRDQTEIDELWSRLADKGKEQSCHTLSNQGSACAGSGLGDFGRG